MEPGAVGTAGVMNYRGLAAKLRKNYDSKGFKQLQALVQRYMRVETSRWPGGDCRGLTRKLFFFKSNTYGSI
uniref:hypothetical protein n=1 Tax=Burkholderia cepacia TaxID=292 RepID=UPI0015E85686|nr:hypothetical protein [Burkholderia cepacia]